MFAPIEKNIKNCFCDFVNSFFVLIKYHASVSQQIEVNHLHDQAKTGTLGKMATHFHELLLIYFSLYIAQLKETDAAETIL